ncbi:DUF6493 family protein [Pedobacter sp. GR22-6]|uniref:DUF6493 family protein n=1 Tax=Pedobacter sp. GR22-6 TaxID=3127957 RepID=UPI00307EAC65
MKKHLKYIDSGSDKFWQIEVADDSYTVTYGRNGTAGVSQTKKFADHAECLKTAEKLLAEKIKKGYSESGEVVKTEAAKVTKAGKSQTTDIGEVLRSYDTIVKVGDVRALLPFLERNTKGNLEALKKQIRKNKKYWLEFIDLSKEPDAKPFSSSSWGIRGNAYQREIIGLSAVATFNKTEIMSWDEAFEVLSNAMEAPVLAILKWANPPWIEVYLLDQARKNLWRRFSYPTLRLLEKESLVAYQPELFAICLAGFNEYNGKMKCRDFIHNVLNDPLAYERDVPELFNYETDLHVHYFRDHKDEPYNAYNTWEIIYTMLLQEGKMNRDYFIEQVILIQTKDWNSNLRSFFRKRLTELSPTADELVTHQENIFSCLHNSLLPVTNFAVDLAKKMYEHQKFAASSFLDWLEPVMMSADNKTAVKNLLSLLEKINKLYPKFNRKIVDRIADVFVIPDMNLQERASKILLKIASEKDNALKEKLSSYIPLMQGNIRSSLDRFLVGGAGSADNNEGEPYVCAPKQEPVLTIPVELPRNWNDILYLFGKFIASDEVADAEMLSNAFIMQTSLFPPDYTMQLQPYQQQLEKKYLNNVYKAYVDVFLRQKIGNYNSPFRVRINQYHKIKTLLLGKELLEAADTRMMRELKSPLLSFPTHRPHWVAPKVLVERLIARQQYDEPIDRLDLSVAISRMPREETQEAIVLLDQLSGELKALMAFCLGVSKEIPIKSASLIGKLFSKIAGPAPEDLKYVWAVAARTYYPEEDFHEFEQSGLKNLDFAVSPFRPQSRIEERWNEVRNYKTNKMERTPSWYELNLDLSAYKVVPSHYLFAQDLYGSKKGWEYQLTEGDVYYWNSLMPQQNDPLGYFLLRGSCMNASSGSDALKGFMNVINSAGFRFSEITMLVFACAFFQEKKEIRIMAAEVLINLIEKRTVDVVLLAEKTAYLASNKYGVFSRLVESLAMLKDVSQLHNSAFLQLMESIFGKLDMGEKLPVNFKRMVEHYVDLLYRTRQRASPDSIAFFEKYKDSASLKTLTKQILNQQT